MWRYEKRLQYPVNITQPNPKMAQFIMSQYGGISQRISRRHGAACAPKGPRSVCSGTAHPILLKYM